jgi:hypothetical protein
LERGEVHIGLVGSAKGERLLGNRDKWKDNIKLGLQEVGLVGIDWSDMAEEERRWRAIVNAVMK